MNLMHDGPSGNDTISHKDTKDKKKPRSFLYVSSVFFVPLWLYLSARI